MLGLGVNVLLFFKDGKMGLNKIVHILQDGRGTLLPGFLYQKPQAGFPSVFDDVGFGRSCFGRDFISPNGNQFYWF